MQDWFAEIAARDRNVMKTTVVENGILRGSFTVTIERNGLGMKQAYNLPWASLCGPNVVDGISEVEEAAIKRQLIKQLPTGISYFVTLAHEADYKLFLLEGFQPALEDNFTVAPDQVPTLSDSFSKMTRRHIRQAERQLFVSTTTAEGFMQAYAADLLSKRRKSYAPLSIARDILDEGLRRGQARIFTANRRDTGEIDAAIACLWDDTRYYYWLTTRRLPAGQSAKPHQGAIKLLLWSAICDAASKGLTFDFDGIPSKFRNKENGTSKLYSGMGGRPTLRYRVTRATLTERIMDWFRTPAKALIRRTIGQFLILKMN